METPEKDPLLITIKPIKLNRLIIALCLFSFIIWPITESAKAGVPVVSEAQQQVMVMETMAQTTLLTSLEGLQAEMTIMQKAIEVAEKSSEYMQQAKTIIQFANLVSAMICSQHRLKALVKQSRLMQMCNYQLNFQMAMLNYSAAIDIMKMIMKGGLKMDQGVRITNMKNAIELLNKAHTQMVALTSVLGNYEMQQKAHAQQMKDISILTSRR